MKKWMKRLIVPIIAVVLIAAWVVYFHNDWVGGMLPHWAQGAVAHLGKHKDQPAEEDDDPDNTKNEIPVHVGHVTVETLHQYIDGIGMVAPRPARAGAPAGSADVVSPVAGIVAKVPAQLGATVHAGDVLIQLDDRIAKATEEQADAALAEAKAAYDVLKSTPRPEQVAIAQEAVDKAQAVVDFAQKNYDRQKQLFTDQGTSAKTVEQAASDLGAAKSDVETAQKQLALLKSSPTPQELAEEQAKVHQAEAALAAATTQRQMLAITAPIDGTVVELATTAGASIDTSRTLVRIVAMDRLMVDVDVPADQLPTKAEGLPAQVFARAATESDATPIDAKVAYVSPEVEAKNGSVMVGIDLPADTDLRPGLTVRIRIVAQAHKDVLAAPSDAVFQNENGDSTVAVVEGEQAIHKEVKTGLHENGLTEISGADIKEGTTVVTAGAYGLQATQATHIKVVEGP